MDYKEKINEILKKMDFTEKEGKLVNSNGLLQAERIMIPIKGFDGYFIDGLDVIGKHGRPLKRGKRDVVQIFIGKKSFTYNIYKVIWCANKRIDVRDVPKNYSFYLENGVVVCDTLSDRMRYERNKFNNAIKVHYDDLDFIERYARTAKEIIKGVPDAKMRLFTMLNGSRDEFIRYARKASGGVSLEKATDYTDQAIYKVYETILSQTYLVCSPVASIKWHINKLIKDGRKHREFSERV